MIEDAIPITSSDLERSIRESWRNQKVLLNDKTLIYNLNEVLISYVFPYECGNF